MAESRWFERFYSLETPEDSRRLYSEWARTYDQDFAAPYGYVVPRETARAYLAEMRPEDQPVLDIGAGTGLVAEHLRALTVDAIDITQEMLDTAGAKGLYRNRIRADLTQRLPIRDADYGGFVCAGTFTHGHVGPVCLPELMRIARPGALFVLSIKPEAFDGFGFGSAFASLVADGAITPVRFVNVHAYEGAAHDHIDDLSLLAIFRRR